MSRTDEQRWFADDPRAPWNQPFPTNPEGAVCSCTVVSHPAGEVWVTHTTETDQPEEGDHA